MRLRSPISHLLVTLQFSAIMLTAWPFLSHPQGHFIWLSLCAAGLVLGLYTLMHNRFGNFAIYPEPLNDACLVTSGPYRRIRHPMYSSLLLCMAGVALFWHAWPNYLGLALLGIAVLGKMQLEERHLRQKFKDYSDYIRRTHRLVPGIY